MDIAIRPARLEDADQISAVNRASILKICSARYAPHEIDVWTSLLTPDKYGEPLRTQIMYVAERGGTIVGYSQLDAERASVQAVYVSPGAVGAGVGRALLKQLELAARRRGLPCLALDATLNAEGFYARLGYRRVYLNEYRLAPDVSLACVHMEKLLR